jgi:hypothetical protein
MVVGEMTNSVASFFSYKYTVEHLNPNLIEWFTA